MFLTKQFSLCDRYEGELLYITDGKMGLVKWWFPSIPTKGLGDGEKVASKEELEE